jgi:hypothetical protein
MYTVVYALKKYRSLRIIVTIALSLGMAWAVGSGIHLNNAPAVTAPANVTPASNAATDNNSIQLNPVSSKTTGTDQPEPAALDQAIKNLNSIQRDRDSANVDSTPQTDTAQLGNSALPNNVSVGDKK